MKETNAQYAKNKVFRHACKIAGIPATTRQASKYRRGQGLAYPYKAAAVEKSVKGETEAT